MSVSNKAFQYAPLEWGEQPWPALSHALRKFPWDSVSLIAAVEAKFVTTVHDLYSELGLLYDLANKIPINQSA